MKGAISAFAGPVHPMKSAQVRAATATCCAEPCAGCGRAEGVAPGCDGAGRVVGGLGAVIDWWPIKAYRPCSHLVSARKQYTRKGQSLDEIAFGRKGTSDGKSLQQRLRGE